MGRWCTKIRASFERFSSCSSAFVKRLSSRQLKFDHTGNVQLLFHIMTVVSCWFQSCWGLNKAHTNSASVHAGFICSWLCHCWEVLLPACWEGSLVGWVLQCQNLLHLRMEVPRGIRATVQWKVTPKLVKDLWKHIPKNKIQKTSLSLFYPGAPQCIASRQHPESQMETCWYRHRTALLSSPRAFAVSFPNWCNKFIETTWLAFGIEALWWEKKV